MLQHYLLCVSPQAKGARFTSLRFEILVLSLRVLFAKAALHLATFNEVIDWSVLDTELVVLHASSDTVVIGP